MKKPEDCLNMEDIRQEIDRIDHLVVELISQRATYVQKAAQFKTSEKAVRDSERVKKVIDSKKTLALKYGVSPELIGNIYSMMIDFFINEEMEEWNRNKNF